jgi:hypothetical protein
MVIYILIWAKEYYYFLQKYDYSNSAEETVEATFLPNILSKQMY